MLIKEINPIFVLIKLLYCASSKSNKNFTPVKFGDDKEIDLNSLEFQFVSYDQMFCLYKERFDNFHNNLKKKLKQQNKNLESIPNRLNSLLEYFIKSDKTHSNLSIISEVKEESKLKSNLTYCKYIIYIIYIMFIL